MEDQQHRDLYNPFIQHAPAILQEGGARVLQWLTMSLSDPYVFFNFARLRELDQAQFDIAMRMLDWFHEHGPADGGFRALVGAIERDGAFDLFVFIEA